MKIDLNLPCGKSGDWEILKFSVDEKEANTFNMHAMFGPCGSRCVIPGKYYKLTYKNEVIMSNTPAEVSDHMPFINNAKGNVLIGGLGLGMVVKALIDSPDVTKITVVELSKDVIKLSGPTYSSNEKVHIVNEDIYKYKPTEKFDYAWFDIWPNICGDNYEDMVKLHRHFRGKISHMMDWCGEECKELHKAQW